MLSLSPRYDLYRFLLPVEFIPEELREKYDAFLAQRPAVINRSIDFLNESIRGITFPGLSDLVVDQPQTSRNRLGRIEPKHDNSTVTTGNPLDKINREITITFRHTQGFLNYFLLFETIFHRICKPENYREGMDLHFDILDEDGKPACRVFLYQCHIDGISGLDLSMDKMDRQSDTFDLTIKFNNIDLEFGFEPHL